MTGLQPASPAHTWKPEAACDDLDRPICDLCRSALTETEISDAQQVSARPASLSATHRMAHDEQLAC